MDKTIRRVGVAGLFAFGGLGMGLWGVPTTVGCPGASVQTPGHAIIDCISGLPATVNHHYAERGAWIGAGFLSAVGVLSARRRRSPEHLPDASLH